MPEFQDTLSLALDSTIWVAFMGLVSTALVILSLGVGAVVSRVLGITTPQGRLAVWAVVLGTNVALVYSVFSH